MMSLQTAIYSRMYTLTIFNLISPVSNLAERLGTVVSLRCIPSRKIPFPIAKIHRAVDVNEKSIRMRRLSQYVLPMITKVMPKL